MKYSRKKSKPVFTDQDFLSGDGFLTTVWGPPMWHYLHTMSFNYPVHPTAADKRNYRAFILGLQHVRPCKYFRINLKTNFKTIANVLAMAKEQEWDLTGDDAA